MRQQRVALRLSSSSAEMKERVARVKESERERGELAWEFREVQTMPRSWSKEEEVAIEGIVARMREDSVLGRAVRQGRRQFQQVGPARQRQQQSGSVGAWLDDAAWSNLVRSVGFGSESDSVRLVGAVGQGRSWSEGLVETEWFSSKPNGSGRNRVGGQNRVEST